MAGSIRRRVCAVTSTRSSPAWRNGGFRHSGKKVGGRYGQALGRPPPSRPESTPDPEGQATEAERSGAVGEAAAVVAPQRTEPSGHWNEQTQNAPRAATPFQKQPEPNGGARKASVGPTGLKSNAGTGPQRRTPHSRPAERSTRSSRADVRDAKECLDPGGSHGRSATHTCARKVGT